MKKDKDTFTYTKQEMEDIRNAFNKLYRIANNQPSSLQDYFEGKEDYVRFQMTKALINDFLFDRSDYE